MPNQKTEALTEIYSPFYGSKLFVKLFLWVWIVLIITTVLVSLYSYYYYLEPEKQRFTRMGREIIAENGQLLVESYEKYGIESAINFRLMGHIGLYNERLENLLNGIPQKYRNPSRILWKAEACARLEKKIKEKKDEVMVFVKNLMNGGAEYYINMDRERLIGNLIISDSNTKYVLIAHMPTPRHSRHTKFLIEYVFEILIIFLLTTGMFCYLLTRYMIEPIMELRKVSKKFANGDLSARVTGLALNRSDEIGDLAIDFNDMAERIEIMISRQQRLFSDISHELRSPLARLMVCLEILQQRVSKTEQPMLVRIEKEIKRMNVLIEEVLQFSKLENTDIKGKTQEFNLAQAISQVCNDANFEGKIQKRTVLFKSECENITISGIKFLVERAVENILRNALRFTAENTEVSVKLIKKEKFAIITIIDKGPGIPEEDLKKVFAPFYNLSEERTPQKGGIGLGLAIALRSIKMHEGQITLNNNADIGLTATITLPLKTA